MRELVEADRHHPATEHEDENGEVAEARSAAGHEPGAQATEDRDRDEGQEQRTGPDDTAPAAQVAVDVVDGHAPTVREVCVIGVLIGFRPTGHLRCIERPFDAGRRLTNATSEGYRISCVCGVATRE